MQYSTVQKKEQEQQRGVQKKEQEQRRGVQYSGAAEAVKAEERTEVRSSQAGQLQHAISNMTETLSR